MNLLVPVPQVARFLSLKPKLVVSATDGWTPELVSAPGGEPAADVWSVEANGDNLRLMPLDHHVHAEWSIVEVPTAAVVAFAACSDAGAAILDQLARWWATAGPRAAPAVCRGTIPADATRAALAALLIAAAAEAREASRGYTAATADLVALRAESDQYRTAQEAMQSELHRLRYHSPLRPTVLVPTGATYAPPSGLGVVTQPLPASMEGLAGVDLYFPTASAGIGQVDVRLVAGDRRETLARWRLRPDLIGRGWVRCWLDEVSADPSHYPEIQVEWTGGAAVPIGLADFGDWDEMAAVTGDGIRLPGCLAATVWGCGLPGAKLPTGLHPFGRSAGSDLEYVLSGADLARSNVVFPAGGARVEWSPLFQTGPASVILHPISEAPITAVLTNGCLPGFDRLHALARIAHKDARSTIRFAILVTASPDAAEILAGPDPASDRRTLAFSGWQDVYPDGQSYPLTLHLPGPLSASAHLAFATRAVPGGTTMYAQAEFSEVRMRLRGGVRADRSKQAA